MLTAYYLDFSKRCGICETLERVHLCWLDNESNKHVVPSYALAEMYAGRVACCPLVSHGEYADGRDRRTDGQTPDCYITLSAMDAGSVIKANVVAESQDHASDVFRSIVQ